MDEEWRPVVGYESLYTVSNLGRVKRTGKARGVRLGRILKPGTYRTGHLFVVLSVRSKEKVLAVHRLVGEAFIGPLPPGMQTRHLDGNPTNNVLTNLAYGTNSENVQDSIRHGTNFNASKTHCKNGHEFTPENIKHNKSRPGARQCRECHRISNRERLRAKRAEARAARLAA